MRTDGAAVELSTRGRPFELMPGSGVAVSHLLPIPPGAYRCLIIELLDLAAQAGEHGERAPWRPIAKRASVELSLATHIGPGTHASLVVELETARFLSAPEDLASAVHVRRVTPAVTLRKITDLRGRVQFSAGAVSLLAPREAFRPDTAITLETPPSGELPPLLRRQRPVGPIVRLRASAAPLAPFEITVPYDDAAVSATSLDPEQMVVLALDEERRRYRELPAIRVDRAARTLTARTGSLSYFFAGTPGFEITHPRFGRNAAGEVVAVSARATTTVAGRAHDERAVVACAEAAYGWGRLGWFVFEGIAVGGAADREVRLIATVEGLVAHELVLVIRRPPPPKRITEPARLYGTAIAVSAGNIPFVSAVINQSQFREDQSALVDEFRHWQLNFDRPAPYVYWFDAEAGGWRYIRLMPDAHLENVVADELITASAGALGIAIPVKPEHADEVRALLSLRDFYKPLLDRRDLASLIIAIGLRESLNEVSRRFGAGHYVYGPTVPLLAVSDDEVEAALVATTGEGSRRAAANPMQAALRSVMGPAFQDDSVRPLVHAGTLWYVRARRDSTVTREKVADDIWCTTVALKRHPLNARAFILAVGLAQPADEDSRTELLLFERRSANDFAVQTVSRDFPVVDADFAFLPDGEPQVFASHLGSQLDKPHLVAFSRVAGDGWRASPVNWRAPFQEEAIDLGAFPRIVADAAGQLTLAFISPILNLRFGALDLGSSYRWLIAKPDAAGWLATSVGSGSVRTLSGDAGFRADDALGFGFLGQSARGAVAFAPALALRGDGRLSYAFGNGALMLATIDRETLSVTARSIDIDRRTGFAPAMALSSNDVSAIAYKDDFGSGDFGPAARDDLHFFSMATGNLVPHPGFAVPLAPSHGLMSVFLGGFAPYVPLTCRTLRDADGLEALLDSVLMHRRFHVEIVEGGEERIVWGHHWAFYGSHTQLNQMIDGLRSRPRILQLTIDNEEHAEEEGIEAVHLTLIEPLARVAGEFAARLDAGEFPDALRRALVDDHGLRMSRASDIQVTRQLAPGEDRSQPGSAWRIQDPNPFGADRLTLPDPALASDSRTPVSVTYDVRRTDSGELEFRVAPLLTVHDRPRFLDADGNQAPCRIAQSLWDVAADLVAPLLREAIPSIAFGDKVRIRRVRISNARISRLLGQRSVGSQQNEFRFVLTIGGLWASGIDPEHFDAEFVAYTTEPSEFRLPVAPFIDSSGTLRWWARAAEARLGALEVDVQDWGDLDFLRIVVPFIPLVGGLAVVIANAIVEDIATDEASEQVRLPDIGTFANLILRRFTAYAASRLPQPERRLEAVHADGLAITLWSRYGVEGAEPLTLVSAIPEPLNFGVARIDQPPPRHRNMLIACDGSLPVALESLDFDPATDEFRLTAPLAWPKILRAGESELIGIEFVPRLPPGDRRVMLRIRYNGDRELTRRIFAGAASPPRPVARVEPELLNFGVVYTGQQQLRIGRIFNMGDGDLDVIALEIVTEPAAAGAFTTTAQPIRLSAGIGVSIPVTYAPLGGLAMPHRGTLRIHTNGADGPVQEIALFGQAATGALLVDPLRIDFRDSQLVGALPFGLGPTRAVHVYNTGAAPLTITAASFRIVDAAGAQSPHFVLSDEGVTPIPDGVVPPPPIQEIDRAIAPGAALVLTVMFVPAAAGAHAARLVLVPSDPALGAGTVAITGTGVA